MERSDSGQGSFTLGREMPGETVHGAETVSKAKEEEKTRVTRGKKKGRDQTVPL